MLAQFLYAPADGSEYDNGYFDPTKTSTFWQTVKHTPDADGTYQTTNVIITCKVRRNGKIQTSKDGRLALMNTCR